MEAYDNEWISSVMTYVRRSWGNSGAPVNPKDIEKVRGWNKTAIHCVYSVRIEYTHSESKIRVHEASPIYPSVGLFHDFLFMGMRKGNGIRLHPKEGGYPQRRRN
jgi:hypothetical protein